MRKKLSIIGQKSKKAFSLNIETSPRNIAITIAAFETAVEISMKNNEICKKIILK